jgi:hypothetical protein
MARHSLARGAVNYVFDMEKEEQTTLENIAGIIRWYGGLKKGFTDIVLLQNAVRKLATYIFMFADELGEFYQARNETEFSRKAETDREINRLMLPVNGGKSATAAGPLAREHVESLLEEEQKADSLYQRAKFFYDASRDVLQAMQQHVSNLKAEKGLEMRGGMVQQK